MKNRTKKKMVLWGFIAAMIIAPVIGIKMSVTRMFEYHDERAESGASEEHHHLGDIESINRPGIYGAGIGVLALIGAGTTGIILLRERRNLQQVAAGNVR